jgi:hypothetical protein
LADVVPVDDTDCLLVLNFRRPSTPDPEGAVAMIREIETVGRLAVTGLISNTHLMAETTPDVVLEGYRMARETSAAVSVPLVAVTVLGEHAAELDPGQLECPLVRLRRIVIPPVEHDRPTRTTGPLFVVN